MFYKAKIVFGGTQTDGEFAETRWFEIDKLTEMDFVPEHRVLYRMFMDNLPNFSEEN
jgi:hypothetical protein